MSILKLKLSTGLIMVVFAITGCVKFEDPTLSEAPEAVSYASPCSEDLNDNISLIYTTTDFLIGSYNFASPTCTGTTIQGNPISGTFQIVLTESITESRTYELSFPFIEAGQAQIQFASSGFAQPTFSSNSGTLYVDVQSDGTTIVEWCDAICQAGNGIPNQKCSGRMVCD